MTREQRNNMIKAIYKNIYKTKEERSNHLDILKEVIFQDKICKDFTIIFTESQLKELLQSKNLIQLSNKVRAHKSEKLKPIKNKYIVKKKAV